MLKKVVAIFSILLVSSIFAHNVLLMVDDNGDGTIYIETGLSTGGTAAGSKLYITERATGRPLWQGVVPDSGSITLPRPNVPYSVTVSMGPGHKVTQKGPDLLPIEKDTTSSISSEKGDDSSKSKKRKHKKDK